MEVNLRIQRAGCREKDANVKVEHISKITGEIRIKRSIPGQVLPLANCCKKRQLHTGILKAVDHLLIKVIPPPFYYPYK